MDWSNKKVTVIDDNALNMKIAVMRLKNYNIEVIVQYESAADLLD